jgi:hypothetical protein
MSGQSKTVPIFPLFVNGEVHVVARKMGWVHMRSRTVAFAVDSVTEITTGLAFVEPVTYRDEFGRCYYLNYTDRILWRPVESVKDQGMGLLLFLAQFVFLVRDRMENGTRAPTVGVLDYTVNSAENGKIVSAYDHFATDKLFVQAPFQKMPDSPMSESPPRMLRRVYRFIREFDLC